MADAYWRYGDGRQQPAAITPQPQLAKRPRSEFEMPTSLGMSGYYAGEDDVSGSRPVKDTDSINASYDRYLQMASFSSEAGRSTSSGILGNRPATPVDDPVVMAAMGGPDPVIALAKSQPIGALGRPEIQLPPDASSTLYVDCLPANCSRREVSHIFRPFVGYKEVRLVTKESRHAGGEPMVFCFVDFQSPAHAATAMDALQGYKFDEHDRDSAVLRFQFARHPGARSGAVRGRR